MSITVLEVLENAHFNLQASNKLQKDIGLEQLANAITALSNGHEIHDDFDEETFNTFQEGRP